MRLLDQSSSSSSIGSIRRPCLQEGKYCKYCHGYRWLLTRQRLSDLQKTITLKTLEIRLRWFSHYHVCWLLQFRKLDRGLNKTTSISLSQILRNTGDSCRLGGLVYRSSPALTFFWDAFTIQDHTIGNRVSFIVHPLYHWGGTQPASSMLAIVRSFADSVFVSLPHSVFADILSEEHERDITAWVWRAQGLVLGDLWLKSTPFSACY